MLKILCLKVKMVSLELDDVDRRLIAQLKLDGRASVTTLAGRLGIARGTVQTRLAKLTETKVIKRFTVEMNSLEAEDLVRAMMMVEVRGNTMTTVQKALQRMPEVTGLYRTCGVWDLVVELETRNLADFDEILNKIRELHGVKSSETCPLLRKVI